MCQLKCLEFASYLENAELVQNFVASDDDDPNASMFGSCPKPVRSASEPLQEESEQRSESLIDAKK